MNSLFPLSVGEVRNPNIDSTKCFEYIFQVNQDLAGY